MARGLSHSVNEADVERTEKSFEVLNSFLEGKQFAAGDVLTIADFTISTSICLVQVSTAAAVRTRNSSIDRERDS